MQAEYKENLLFGGKLVVTAAHIEIVCYFRGPDLRYRGEWIHIPYSNFDEYISAFRHNFKKYEELKTQMKDCEFSCVGVCGMKIRTGSRWGNGVTISQWRNHMHPMIFPIDNEEKLEQVIFDFEYAKVRGVEIQQLLFAQ